ncbi:hypothetical protein N7510_008296 [Penicillium lagena]|uniref:uncharacterized protein n=1 Tax=Penicillium lagena TaxID=94218 RepID=UPI002540405D|nr:uncharacterized protein N7510_008296 [Penicillium lagena]KAJ5605515.1 hypothetical protein N7510_008296 [Penicillium lagena]
MPLLQSQHEGFTFAYLYSFANNILLNPIFAISVLIGSLAILTNQLVFPFLTNNFDVEASKLSLSFAFLFGILYKSNQLLSRLALNNYVRDPSWDWTREIVLVTGGSSGIGKAIVRHFADKSIKVVILDQHLPELPPSIGATFYKVDITSSKEIGEAALKIRREVGEPTVLINNAGIGSSSSILEESDEQTMRVLETNLLAHFKLVREFLPYMIEHNHGHVVTVASMASFASMVKNASYAASKAGVQAFHESLAQEVHSLHHASRVRTS